MIQFIHFYWTPDGGAVAFVACGTDNQRVAYDLKRRRDVPFDKYETEMEQSLLGAYGEPEIAYLHD